MHPLIASCNPSLDFSLDLTRHSPSQKQQQLINVLCLQHCEYETVSCRENYEIIKCLQSNKTQDVEGIYDCFDQQEYKEYPRLVALNSKQFIHLH